MLTNTAESALTSSYTSRTAEATNKGAHGDAYEENIVTLQALILHSKTKLFEVASNDVSGGKFDDIVVKFHDKNNQQHEAIIQIKHGDETGNKIKNLAIETLLAVGNKQKISLIKFFAKYLESNMKGKNLYLFTNRKLKFEREKNRERKIIEPKRCQFEVEFESKEYKFVYFDDVEDTSEYLVTQYGENYKLNVDLSPDFVKLFKKKYFDFKEAEANDTDIKNFFDDLTFSVGQMTDKKSEEEIIKLIRKKISDASEIELVLSKIKDLLKIKNNEVKTLTFDEVENVFNDVKISSIFIRLKQIPADMQTEIEKYCFESSFVGNLKSDIQTKIFTSINTPKGLEKVVCRAVYQTFSCDEIKSGKIICMCSNTFKIERENILKITKSFEYLLVTDEDFDHEVLNKLQLLSDRLKIIFVSSYFYENLGHENLQVLKIENIVTTFDINYQEKLYKSYPINFQNKLVYPSEIFETIDDFIKSMDDKSLAQILLQNLSLGDAIEGPNFNKEFYIEREYESENEPFIPEKFKTKNFVENLLKFRKRMPVLIHDLAGMGKSTEITKIGLEIKEHRKDFWVLKIELGSEKFSSALNSWDKESLTDLLESYVENKFESTIFHELYKSGKVAVLLDGFDEIKSSSFEQVLSGLFVKILLENVHKNIFVFTSRTNLVEDLINHKTKRYQKGDENLRRAKKSELHQKYDEKIKIFHLKPFDKEQQENFMIDWITKSLSQDLMNKTSKEEIFTFCNALIAKWSVPITDGSDFLGIPLQIRMLAETFAHSVSESLNNLDRLPEIPERLNHTELFRTFINTKLLVLFRDKKLNAQELFVKMFNGEINAQEILLNLACDSLCNACYVNMGTIDNNQFWAHVCAHVQRLETPPELQKMMINVGLINNFSNFNANFLHKAYPEFLVAEKFIKIIFDEKSSQNCINEPGHVNDKVFQVILYQRLNMNFSTHQMIPKFIEEFLKLKGMPPENGRKILLLYLTTMSCARQIILETILNEGLTNFFMLVIESLQMGNSTLVFDAMEEAISNGITRADLEKSENVLKCFSMLLTKVFELLTNDNSNEAVDKAFVVISRIMFTVFNNDPNHETLKLVRKWSILKDENMRQKLVSKWMSFHYGKSSEDGDMNFLKFWHEFDSNLITSLIKPNEEEFCYTLFLDLHGFVGPLNFLEKWAAEKGINLEEDTKIQIRHRKNQTMEFFKKINLAPSVKSIQNSKYLGPKELLKLLKENVEQFDDISFPFVVFWDLKSFNESKHKLKKAEEIFANNFQHEYQEYFNMWLGKVSKVSKIWNHCHLRNRIFPYPEYDSNVKSYELNSLNCHHFIARSMILFIHLGKLTIESLDSDVFEFLYNYLLGHNQLSYTTPWKTDNFIIQSDKIYAKFSYVNRLHLNLIPRFMYQNINEASSDHSCNNCILCIKTNHEYCKDICK